jgi:hypothetical protein
MAMLSACNWGKPPVTKAAVNTDTLAYQYKTIKERASDCGTKPDSICTHVSIKYPEFAGQQKLNDTIAQKLMVMFSYEGKTDNSLVAYSKNFIKGYDDFKKENRDTHMYFELDSHAEVITQDSGLVALEVGGYNFQGGAHGASYTGYINWDVKANKNLKLKDLLVDKYQTALNKIAEKQFRLEEKLSDTASLATNYFFKDNKFSLNDNFSITPIGLKFLYNQYEIKPYAAGQTEMLIPYGQIRELIKPNTILSQYINK